jgi:anti-sigma B factor antagonist
MRIDAAREGGTAVLRLAGRLDREWAEHLSGTMEDLLRTGARSFRLDLTDVTYISSAATAVLERWRRELAVLRGDIQLTALSPAVRETIAIAGWSPEADVGRRSGPITRQQSTWQLRAVSASSGEYQTSTNDPDASLTCRLLGRARLDRAEAGGAGAAVVDLPADTFGLGLGAIGWDVAEARGRVGELVAMAGCVAHFPSDGARKADYLIGDGGTPRAVLASGLACTGGFAKLVRFGPRGDAGAIPLSELAAVCLEAAGDGIAAGVVIAAETAGLTGARLLRSPAAVDGSPLSFEVPAIRDWISFAPEQTHGLTTALIAGVVARTPEPPLAEYLLPLEVTERLHGHFHAAVFGYHPLPQRTVELGALVRGVFAEHPLRDVLHLLWDDREDGVGESALVRGVGWVAPITRIA